MLNIGSEDHVDEEWIGLAWLDVSSNELEFPYALNPLSDALQGGDILQKLVCLWWTEDELDNLFLASCNSTLGVVAFEVLVRSLKQNMKFSMKVSNYENSDYLQLVG